VASLSLSCKFANVQIMCKLCDYVKIIRQIRVKMRLETQALPEPADQQVSKIREVHRDC